MMRCEFEKLINGSVTDREYEIIEKVYLWHPLMADKECCAKLYSDFGITIFLDMLPRANMCKVVEEKMRKNQIEASRLKEEYESLKNGTAMLDSEGLPDPGRKDDGKTNRGRDGAPHE